MCVCVCVCVRAQESEVPGAMILVGNKQDRDEFDEREVSCETGETFAKVSHFILKFNSTFSFL